MVKLQFLLRYLSIFTKLFAQKPVFDDTNFTLEIIGTEHVTLSVALVEEFPKTRRLILKETSLKYLPNELRYLDGLKELIIQDNQMLIDFSGLALFKGITLLEISGNSLKTAPQCIAMMDNLQHLDLSRNEIDVFPEVITNVSRLSFLSLKDNKIETIPMQIGNLIDLQCLDLSYNRFSKFNVEMLRLQSLKKLFLCNNDFVTLPVELCALGMLQVLDLSQNNILSLVIETTEIVKLTKKYSEMRKRAVKNYYQKTDQFKYPCVPQKKQKNCFFNIIEKRLIDKIDAKIKSCGLGLLNLNNLTALCLQHNKITGIPDEFAQPNNPKSLSLHKKNRHNAITIPKTHLKYLNLSDNEIKSVINVYGAFNTPIKLFLENNYITNTEIEMLKSTHHNKNVDLVANIQYSSAMPLVKALEISNSQDIHWNTSMLNTIVHSTDLIEVNKTITHNCIQTVWERVCKCLLLNLDPATTALYTNLNRKYSSAAYIDLNNIKMNNNIARKSFFAADTFEANRKKDSLAMLDYRFNKAFNDEYPFSVLGIEKLTEKMTTWSVCSNTKNSSMYIDKDGLLQKVSSYMNNILNPNYPTEKQDVINLELIGCIKIVFYMFLKKVYIIGDDAYKMAPIMLEFKKVWRILLNPKKIDQLDKLYPYYLDFCLEHKTIVTQPLTVMIKKRLSLLKESCFLDTINGTMEGNEKVGRVCRSVFRDLIGINCRSYTPNEIGNIVLSDRKQGSCLNKFFNLFSKQNVIRDLLEIINKDALMVKQSFDLLSEILAKKVNKKYTVNSQISKYSAYDKKNIYSFFNYSTPSYSKDVQSQQLKAEGLLRILIYMEILETKK